MKIFSDVLNFVKALRFVDVVFFLAVIVLIALMVTLLYFIRINDEKDTKEKAKEERLETTREMQIVEELKKNAPEEPNTIKFTDYEKDQEDKAIISYDELLNKGTNSKISYESERTDEDISIKKINFDNVGDTKSEGQPRIVAQVISLAKEEAFLNALKRLEKELG